MKATLLATSWGFWFRLILCVVNMYLASSHGVAGDGLAWVVEQGGSRGAAFSRCPTFHPAATLPEQVALALSLSGGPPLILSCIDVAEGWLIVVRDPSGVRVDFVGIDSKAYTVTSENICELRKLGDRVIAVEVHPVGVSGSLKLIQQINGVFKVTETLFEAKRPIYSAGVFCDDDRVALLSDHFVEVRSISNPDVSITIKPQGAVMRESRSIGVDHFNNILIGCRNGCWMITSASTYVESMELSQTEIARFEK